MIDLSHISSIRAALKAHNSWHLSQGGTTADGITWNLAEAYADSMLYDQTQNALHCLDALETYIRHNRADRAPDGFAGFKFVVDPSVPDDMVLVKDQRGKTILKMLIAASRKEGA